MGTTLQLYAKLCAIINGSLQEEMADITIQDGVNKPARVTLSSCMPESGAEFDARKRMGEHVEVAVIILNYGRAPSDAILAMHGKVVESRITQRDDETVRYTFTIEHCEPEPEVSVEPVRTLRKGYAGDIG